MGPYIGKPTSTCIDCIRPRLPARFDVRGIGKKTDLPQILTPEIPGRLLFPTNLFYSVLTIKFEVILKVTFWPESD
jgi:hypothetical protein